MSEYIQSHRVKDFVELVDDTTEALQDPTLKERLGETGPVLLDLMSRTFLPDVSKGKASIPKEYKDEPEAIPMLPITDDEARNVTRLIAPLVQATRRVERLDEKVFSRGHGRKVDSETLIDSLRLVQLKETSRAKAKATKPVVPKHYGAITFCLYGCYIEHSIRESGDRQPYRSRYC